jgi:hypothetical protein
MIAGEVRPSTHFPDFGCLPETWVPGRTSAVTAFGLRQLLPRGRLCRQSLRVPTWTASANRAMILFCTKESFDCP